MSRKKDGSYRCDRDGHPLTNGGVLEALVVVDLDPVSGGTRSFHFCRANGCAKKILSKRNLADHMKGNT